MVNAIPQVLRYIYETYGHVVVLDQAPFHKFGENPIVGTAEATLMEFLGTEKAETYVSANDIDGIVCDGTFTGDVEVSGHTVSANVLTPVVQTVTMTSQTKVTLDTPLHRCDRLKNASAVDMPAASKIYCYASAGVSLSLGVPQTASSVKCIMSASENQSLKCSVSVDGSHYLLITDLTGGVDKKTQGGGSVRLKVRERGGVFQTKYKLGINSLGPNLNTPLPSIEIIKPNSDVIVTSEADAATTPIAGNIIGFLGTITNA